MPNLEINFWYLGIGSEKPDSSEELATGETGELYFRGPNAFLGYHKNPSATAECLSTDRWFRSGDIGFMDQSGNVFVTDRVKELIKYKGYQVAPAELEGHLLEHPRVSGCAVVGVYSERLHTKVPRAYIVKTAPELAVVDADDISQWLNKRIASYKRLRGGMVFVASISKSPSGKILRRVLKEQAKAEFKDEKPIVARI